MLKIYLIKIQILGLTIMWIVDIEIAKIIKEVLFKRKIHATKKSKYIILIQFEKTIN